MCDKHASPMAGDDMSSQLRSGEFCSIASSSSDKLTHTPAAVAQELLERHAVASAKVAKKMCRKPKSR